MSDETQVQTTAPITITLDIATLAKHLVPDYDAPYDEDGPPAMGALDSILGHVAALLVKDIRKEYVKAAAARAEANVEEQVSAIVRSVLDEGGVVGDGYSARKTKPLRELIRDEVQQTLTKPVSDGPRYGGNGQTPLIQKIVKDEVEKTLRADLASILTEERERFREAVRTLAAATLADDAARRR